MQICGHVKHTSDKKCKVCERFLSLTNQIGRLAKLGSFIKKNKKMELIRDRKSNAKYSLFLKSWPGILKRVEDEIPALKQRKKLKYSENLRIAIQEKLREYFCDSALVLEVVSDPKQLPQNFTEIERVYITLVDKERYYITPTSKFAHRRDPYKKHGIEYQFRPPRGEYYRGYQVGFLIAWVRLGDSSIFVPKDLYNALEEHNKSLSQDLRCHRSQSYFSTVNRDDTVSSSESFSSNSQETSYSEVTDEQSNEDQFDDDGLQLLFSDNFLEI